MQGIGYLDEPGAPGRNSPPLPLSLKSECSGRWTEDRESSLSCILSACWACPREGRVWFQWHLLIPVLSLSNSLILPSLLTSCLNSGYKGGGSSALVGAVPLPLLCTLLLSWKKSRAHPAAWHWHQAGSTFPLELWAAAESSWGQSIERSWLSAGWALLLPGWAARASLAFVNYSFLVIIYYNEVLK